MEAHHRDTESQRVNATSSALLWQRRAKFSRLPAESEPASESNSLRRKLSRSRFDFLLARMPQAYQILLQRRRHLINNSQRFSKSTGSLTSVTRKYFPSAGYFFATASYIA
jgi:hypothetical protein